MSTMPWAIPPPDLLALLLAAHLVAALVVGAMLVAEWRRGRRGAAPVPGGSPAAGEAGFSPRELQRLRFVAWRYRRGVLTEWPPGPAGPGLPSCASADDAAA